MNAVNLGEGQAVVMRTLFVIRDLPRESISAAGVIRGG